MAQRYAPCVVELLKNQKEDFINAAGVLVRIARKIEGNPELEKYRSLKIGSRTFMESILPFDGAVECLYEMGFTEDNDRYVHVGDVGNLKVIKKQLEELLDDKQSENLTHKSSNIASPGPSMKTFDYSKSEAEILQRIISHKQAVLTYEDRVLQAKARSVVPVTVLEEKAQQRLTREPEFPDGKKLAFRDCLILELLHWFKHDFFTWTDAPDCDVCGETKPMSIGMLTPEYDEQKWGANRVEGYKCVQCGKVIRFPRYNHPMKLLETRTGRCGEWANCFSLLCRSFGYDTRHVVDWTDHVWTEVYSHAAKRWLHCDPCENTCDKPLLYEQGWGKKLSLVVAFSCEEIVDVTWRYTDSPTSVAERRRSMFRESWLRNEISSMRADMMITFDPATRERINSRLVREMVEFISPKVKRHRNYGGRTTGSLQWRKARGELGGEAQDSETTIVPTTHEIERGRTELLYFSSADRYARTGSDDIQGWEALAQAWQNIERKVEDDWKMAYIARTPSSESAHISWKVDVSSTGCCIKEVRLLVNSTVFQTGKIKWLICTEKASFHVESGVERRLREVDGAHTLSLHAFLSGGEGENSWQHTQLFRESLEPAKEIPQLKLLVFLSPNTE